MTNPTTPIKRIEDYEYDTYSTSYDCPYETYQPSADEDFYGWEHYVPHKNFISEYDYDDLDTYEDEPYAY